MKHWKPYFIENSKIPIWLSKIAPIDISAITLGPIVISRDEMSEITKNHETIHFQQYLETGFIGFLLIYLYDYIIGYIKYRDGKLSYLSLRAEREAYTMHEHLDYCSKRDRWAWLKRDSFTDLVYLYCQQLKEEET
jgi:hypothetical protein